MKDFLNKAMAFAKSLFGHTVTVAATDAPARVNAAAGTGSVITTITTTATAPSVFDTDADAAIKIVNNIKNALASPVAVLVSDMIPVTIVGDIREALVTELPQVAADIAFIKNLLDTSDKSAQFNDVLAQIKLSPNADMNAFYHALGARVLGIVSKGKSGWSEAVIAVEYYLKEVVEAVIAPAAAQGMPTALAAAAPPAEIESEETGQVVATV